MLITVFKVKYRNGDESRCTSFCDIQEFWENLTLAVLSVIDFLFDHFHTQGRIFLIKSFFSLLDLVAIFNDFLKVVRVPIIKQFAKVTKFNYPL